MSAYTTGLQFKVQDTADRVLDGTKTVTRRKQGRRVGALARAYRRHQTTGDPPFAEVRIVSSEAVPLVPMTAEEVAAEGFPGKSPEWFYGLYRSMYGIADDVNPTTWRIEFRLARRLRSDGSGSDWLPCPKCKTAMLPPDGDDDHGGPGWSDEALAQRLHCVGCGALLTGEGFDDYWPDNICRLVEVRT